MSDEARESVILDALEAMDWRTLDADMMAAFILGVEGAARAGGIRQAREAALHAALNGTGYRAVDRIIAALDAL
jgi:hypothetical protein